MSRKQRLALVAATIVVAVVAFVIAKPGGDDDEPATTAVQTHTTPTETEAKPAIPRFERIAVRGGKPAGGVKEISVKQGDRVRFIVSAKDTSDEVHLHGYDLTKNMAPGKPARFSFKANIEGVFEAELHGAHTQVISLKVEPR